MRKKQLQLIVLIIRSMQFSGIARKPASYFLVLCLLLTQMSVYGQAQPTFTCETNIGFLFQDNPTDAYTVNLSTGEITLAKADLLGTTNAQLNAFGYNPTDNYVWGYHRGTNEVVRVGSDWSVQTFPIAGLPATGEFFIGDVSSTGVLYLYNNFIANTTIYRVDVNPSSATYLTALPPLTTTASEIADWAFSPIDGNLYSIGIGGNYNLLRFNPTTGVRTSLGPVTGGGVQGDPTFGAVYMDNEGSLILSNNNTGNIFKIANPHAGNTTATFVANGPTSFDNDGARCPTGLVGPGVTISGTIHSDPDGGTISGPGTNAGGTLFATLVNSTGTPIANDTVAANGTYSFLGIGSGTYTVVLGTAPSSTTGSLPTGYVNTNEGLTPTGDGTTNGIIPVTVANVDITTADFAIQEEQPTDLSIIKTGPASVAPNGTVTYKLLVTNVGPGDADGAIVTDPAVANLTGTTVTCAAGSGVGGSAACPASPTIAGLQGSGLVIPALPSGGSITLTVTGTAEGSGTITNTATVAAPAGTIDSDPANNTSTRVTTIDPNCTNQTVYSFDPIATNNAAAATAGANGGTVNLVYNLTSGPAIAGMGTTFTIPMTYTDFNQAFSGSNHTWDRYEAPFGAFQWDGVNSTQAFSLVPNEQSFYTALPANNATQEPVLGNTDNFFTNRLANNTLDQLGTFAITIGAVPTPPAGVTLVSESIRIFSSNNLSTNGNGNDQAGWWLKSIAQNAINTTTGGQTVPLAVSHGNTYSFRYSAFTDNSNFADDAGGRGVLFDLGQMVFCTQAETFTVSGTVHSDPDGGDISGAGTNAGSTLYATLLDSIGSPIATDTVAADGTYLFPNIASGDYSVVLGTTPNDSTAGLPAGYINTNEGLTPTGDGTTDGIIPVTVTAANITTADFAIEQLPVATPATVPGQPNPGGTTTVDITPYLTGTDPDGTIDSLYFPTFPDNVVTLVIDGIPYDSTSFPTGGVTVAEGSSVLVDPVDGAVTPVILFSVVDNAGEADPTPANVTVLFTSVPSVTLSGTVHSDPDAGDISGPGTNAGNTLLVTLLDSAGTPVATDSVAADGTYSFLNVVPGDYTVILSTTPNDSTSVLPTGYVNTNEGLTPTGDGTTDGTIPVTVAAVDVINADFAIEQLPTATPATVPGQPNPGGTITVDITPYFTGTDPDGTVDSLYFPTFPDNVVTLVIDGTPYDSTNFPAGGVNVPEGSSVLIDPVDGAVTPVILFSVIDNAGEEDPTPANVTVPFTTIPGVTLSGTVHSDPDAGDINGPGTNAGNTLLVTLLDNAGTPVATDSVAADGTYLFLDVVPGDYTVVLSTTPNDSMSVLPAGYVNTNEGLTPIGDGTTDGTVPVAVAAVDITTADFAIEQLPAAISATVPGQPNPGGTTTVDITQYFTGTDPDGTVDSLYFPTFPDNVVTLVIGGTPYDSTSFPADGVTVPEGSTVLIDPVDGAVTPVILFSVVDNAGEADPTPANVTVLLTSVPGVTLSGTVFNDADGGDINGIGTNVNDSLYVTLLDSTGAAVATDTVAADGTYSFLNVTPGDYTIILGTIPNDSTAGLPTGWINTNEGLTTTGDGTLNGMIPVTITNVDVTTADFAIERPPLTPSEPITTLPQPNPEQIITLDGQTDNPPALSGTDPEDGTQGAGDRLIITTLPLNGLLLYNGAPVIEDDTIDSYDPSLFAVQLTGSGYTEVTFEYAFLDSAGVQSPPALYTLNWDAPLPVTLISFTAKVGEGQNALLEWSTTQETNSDRFEIERNVNGKGWAMIGSVIAKGESSVLSNYTFVDTKPVNGMNLYRLKMMDRATTGSPTDANFAYSRIRSIDFDIPVRVMLYPNPVVDKLMLDINDISAIENIQIYDLAGKLVLDQKKREKADLSRDIDVKGLPAGTYVVRITAADGNAVSLKIVKI